MLLEFKIGNYLSFKDVKTFSLIAASITDYRDSNVVYIDKYKILKSAVIYGANASGKTSLIRAMSTMRRLVLQSFEQSSTSELKIHPFLLNSSTEEQPSSFEVLFIHNGIKYRYGFEVNNTTVCAEWLFETRKNTEKPLFIREGDGIEVMPSFKEGKNLEEKTRDNALFLAVVDQFNGPVAKSIMQWFKHFIAISGLRHERFKSVTFRMLESEEGRKQLLSFYKYLNLGFDNIKVAKKPFNAEELPSDISETAAKQLISDLEGPYKLDIKTIHKKFDENNEAAGLVEFDMRTQESSGTNKVFNMSGPIFDVLINGGVLVIDELDASLHPLMTLALTNLFNSTESNPHNAQLVFATHDTNLFEYGFYRRDQIYFVEKDQYGASDLYSLVEYRGDNDEKVREDSSFERDYIKGRYGAIPYIGDVSTFFSKLQENNSVDQWREK